jgi:hypothetical protein
MYLFYDTISRMFSIRKRDNTVEFLGPPKHTMLVLQSYGYTEGQARDAVTRGIMGNGNAVPLDDVVKMASLFREVA